MDYVVATHELAERPVISIRDRHPQAELPGFIGDAFAALFGRVELLGVKPAGHPFVIYMGRYEDLGDAYAVLTEWVRRNGFEAAGPGQERYLNGPGDQVLPAEYRTEIEIPIVPVAVPVG